MQGKFALNARIIEKPVMAPNVGCEIDTQYGL